MPLLVALVVAFLDGLVTYLQVKEREQWVTGRIAAAVLLEGFTALAIGVTILLFVNYSWWMLVPSVAGTMAGRWLAWRW